VVHDAEISPTATTFDVTVSGVEGALCALYYDGTLYGSAFTDVGGNASIPIGEAPPIGVDLTLTATAFNAMPYFGTVTVVEQYVPEIDVTPTAYNVVLDPEEVLVETLLVRNTGEPLSVLHFDIEIVDGAGVRSIGRVPAVHPQTSSRTEAVLEEPRIAPVYGPVSWLSASPMSGDVPSGAAQEVELTFDTSGMSAGEYLADINIDSNGGERVVVPVVLTVESTGVDEVPTASVLYGNYPNPFRPSTRISFAIPADAYVRVSVFDVRGRHVRTLADDVFEAGPHDLPWDGTNWADEPVASGVYFYRLEAGARSHVGKMILMR
jgi:hypothetical protein